MKNKHVVSNKLKVRNCVVMNSSHHSLELHGSAACYNAVLKGRNPLFRTELQCLGEIVVQAAAVFVRLKEHSVHRAGNYFLIFTVLKCMH